MEGVYGWIRSLTGFFLFMAVTDNLLPGTGYRKYIRLFSGMVLILLALQPLTGGLRLEDTISRFYESLVFQYEAEGLKGDILGIEKQRLEQMIGRYEEAVAADVAGMAEAEGFEALECRASIGAEEEGGRFGMVTGIWLKVRRGAGERTELPVQGKAAEQESAAGPPEPVAPVEPVVIGAETGTETGTEAGTEPKAYQGRRAPEPELLPLRRRIQSYYHLEEQYVEIQLAEGQG